MRTPVVRRAGSGERGQLPAFERLGADERIDLGDHRREPRGEDPLLGVLDHGPAALRRPAGVRDVATPQGEGRGGQVVQPGELWLTHGVELEGGLPEQGRRLLAGLPLGLDGGELDDRGQEDDPDRQPGRAPGAQLARLFPAAEEEQRLGHVAGEQVAVHRLESGSPCLVDARVRDVDRLRPLRDEVEDRGQVGPDPEEGIGVVELTGGPLGVAQQLDGGARIAAPGHGDAERRQGMDFVLARDRLAGARDLDRLVGDALGIREDAVQHGQPGERGETRCPRRGWLARHEVDRPPRGGHGPDLVAGSAADVGEPFVEQTEPDPIAPRVEGADGDLEIGRRPGRAADGERGLRRPDLEPEPVPDRSIRPTAATRPDRGPRGWTGRARARTTRRPRRGVRGDARRLDRCGDVPRSRVVGHQPMARRGRRRTGQRRPRGRRDGGLGTGSRSRSTARPMDSWRIAIVPSPSTTNPCSSASARPAAGPRQARRRRARGPEAVRGAGRSSRPRTPRPTRPACAGVSGRPAGARSAAGSVGTRASGRPAGGPSTSSSNEPVSETPGSSRRAESSSSATSGMPAERSATRRSSAGRRPFALDPFDERRQLVTIEGWQRPALDRLRRGGKGRSGPRPTDRRA